jgi:hypothetical protein
MSVNGHEIHVSASEVCSFEQSSQDVNAKILRILSHMLGDLISISVDTNSVVSSTVVGR